MTSSTRPPLHVGLDASAAAVPQPTGVGLAIAHLAEALGTRPGLELSRLYRLSRFRRRRHFLPGPARLYHERWSLLLARQLDVFHGPDSRLPGFSGPALVATVHDLSARRPGFSSDRFRRLRESHWSDVVRRARLVVTYTEAVRQEVVRELGLPPERVTAVPLAPTTQSIVPTPSGRAAVERLTGGRPFVLYLGEISRRKNALGALAAFRAAGEGLQDHLLVLAGPRGRGAEEVEAALSHGALRERVRTTSYLPGEQVAALLAGAGAFLFPSRYEGFGMPILEAFAAGVPVVASRDPSVLEVAGGAALHADLDDADGLGQALLRAVLEPNCRSELLRLGRERLDAFSWERSGARLEEVYRAAAEGRPAPEPEALSCSQ